MIKQQRKRQRITQQKLSQLTGLSQSYISNLEKEKFTNSPTLTTIIELSKVLELDLIDLTKWFLEKQLHQERG